MIKIALKKSREFFSLSIKRNKEKRIERERGERGGGREKHSNPELIKPKKLTTLPGLRLERRQVDVSVVQQLKHRRRTRSLSFVAASSV